MLRGTKPKTRPRASIWTRLSHIAARLGRRAARDQFSQHAASGQIQTPSDPFPTDLTMTQAISSSSSGFATEFAELVIRSEASQQNRRIKSAKQRAPAFARMPRSKSMLCTTLLTRPEAAHCSTRRSPSAGQRSEIKAAFSQYGADMASAHIKSAECAGDAATALSAGTEFASQNRLATLWRTSGEGMVKLAAPLQAWSVTAWLATTKRKQSAARHSPNKPSGKQMTPALPSTKPRNGATKHSTRCRAFSRTRTRRPPRSSDASERTFLHLAHRPRR